MNFPKALAWSANSLIQDLKIIMQFDLIFLTLDSLTFVYTLYCSSQFSQKQSNIKSIQTLL